MSNGKQKLQIFLSLLGLPRIANPHIVSCQRCVVVLLHHVLRKLALLGLVLVLLEISKTIHNSIQVSGTTYVKHKDEEVSLLALTTQLLLRRLNVLLEFPNGIFQRRPGVIDLVHDEDVLSDQVVHLQRAQVQPLCASDLCTRNLFGVAATQVFVERQTDSLDGNVGLTGALQEGAIQKIN